MTRNPPTCATVLFALLQRLWSACEHWRRATACAAALLWAVHPLNSQYVNYIAQRSESLMALFYLLYSTFSIDIQAAGRRSRRSCTLCTRHHEQRSHDHCALVTALLYDRAFISGSLHAALARRPLLYGDLRSCLLCAALPHCTTPRRIGGIWFNHWSYSVFVEPISHHSRLSRHGYFGPNHFARLRLPATTYLVGYRTASTLCLRTYSRVAGVVLAIPGIWFCRPIFSLPCWPPSASSPSPTK